MLLVAVDALNAFFFFVAGVALAAELGVESCGNEVCFLLYSVLQAHKRVFRNDWQSLVKIILDALNYNYLVLSLTVLVFFS